MGADTSKPDTSESKEVDIRTMNVQDMKKKLDTILRDKVSQLIQQPEDIIETLHTLKALLSPADFAKQLDRLKEQFQTIGIDIKYPAPKINTSSGGAPPEDSRNNLYKQEPNDVNGVKDVKPEYQVMDKIIKKYEGKTANNKGDLLEAAALEHELNEADLNPNEVLKLQIKDKYIFVMIIILVRLISVYLTEWAITIGYVNTFMSTMLLFVIIYTFLIMLVLLLVNSGDFGFRILINYLNTDSPGMFIRVGTHLFLVWMILAISFTILTVQGEVLTRPNYMLSENEQTVLISNFESITNIIWLVIIVVSFMAQ